MANKDLENLLIEYEQKRRTAELEADNRKNKLYEKFPEIQKLDFNINKLTINKTKNILVKNTEINKKIGIFCREKDKLVNVVDNPDLSNFIVPSCLKRGDLIISVSTCGKSPSLASKIKKDLEVTYDDSYEEYVNLLGEIRIKILEKYNDSREKKKLLNEIINLSLEELKKYEI